MAKLVMIVEIPDAEPIKEDPHEAAADILYHYEEHRTVNQDERDVRFVVASWADFTEPTKLEFSETVTETIEIEPEFTKVWPIDYDDSPEWD